MNLAYKMGDKIHSQSEHLSTKYLGTGPEATRSFQWLLNKHREGLAKYLEQHDQISFFAMAENETKARIRFCILERMLQPAGLPPYGVEVED